MVGPHFVKQIEEGRVRHHVQSFVQHRSGLLKASEDRRSSPDHRPGESLDLDFGVAPSVPVIGPKEPVQGAEGGVGVRLRARPVALDL